MKFIREIILYSNYINLPTIFQRLYDFVPYSVMPSISIQLLLLFEKFSNFIMIYTNNNYFFRVVKYLVGHTKFTMKNKEK